MTRLMVDAAMREKLCNPDSLVEVCDEAGQVFGFFYPTTPVPLPAGWRSPFSEEEIQKRRQEKGGKSLAEILKELGAT